MELKSKLSLSNLAARLIFVAGLSACSGNGCSTQKIKGGFPVAQRHENVVQVHAGKSFFDYVTAQGPTLIAKLLPTGTKFAIPPQCSGNKICCETPNEVCDIQFDFKSLSLTPVAPEKVELDALFNLDTIQNLPVSFSILSCDIAIDTTHHDGPIHVTGNLELPVNGTTDLTNIEVTDLTIANLTAADLTISDPPSAILPACTALGSLLPGQLIQFVIDQLTDQLKTQVQNAVSGATCMKCDSIDDCNSFATSCKGGSGADGGATSGTCVGSDGMTCVQQLGLDGRLDFGALVASISPGVSSYVDILAAAGGYSTAANGGGVSLGALGGGLSEGHNACVPVVAPPTLVSVPESPTYASDKLPDGTTPYHIGIGLHSSYINLLAYSIWDSGGLCLNVGSSLSSQLSTRTFKAIIPSIGDIVTSDEAPLFLVTRPQQPPTASYGKGTFKTDSNGKTIVDDPMLSLSMPDFAIDIYIFIDDRYVRVLTLTADVNIGVSLDIDMNGQILPLLSDTSNALSNVRVTNIDLLSETADQLQSTFPTLLKLALSTLTGSLSAIKLPTVMGFNIEPVSIQTTDPSTAPDGAGPNQFLGIFANIMATTPVLRGVDTLATVERLDVPITAEFSVTSKDRELHRPMAHLHFGTVDKATAPLEYSYAIDDGAWSPFSNDDSPTIDSPLFWLQGRHHVDVRGRLVGAPKTLDATPARVELVIDSIAPTGELKLHGSDLLFVADDNVSAKEMLTYRYRLSDGGYSGWSWHNHVRLPEGSALETVSVQARDEAGNIGHLFLATDPVVPATGGCHVTGPLHDHSGSGTAFICAVALAVGVFCRRRKSRRQSRLRRFMTRFPLSLGLIALSLTLLGCDDGKKVSQGDLEPPDAEIGRWSDLALHGSVFHLSAYDSSHGDLTYAEVTDVSKTIEWIIVDGVDLTAAKDRTDAYRHGISDAGPDVGMYSSLQLTSNGDPRIAYYDATNRALKYAVGPFPFSVQTVQAGSGSLDVGKYASLSLDKTGVPTIAYIALGVTDGSGFKSEFRVATASSSHPSSPGDWKIAVVDTTKTTCAGICGAATACLRDAMVNGQANSSDLNSSCVAVDTSCTTCSQTQACIAGVCADVVSTASQDLPEGTGLFTQSRRTSKDQLTLVYYDRMLGQLKLAIQASDGSFAVSMIDGSAQGNLVQDVGQFVSAQFDSSDVLQMVYVDALKNQLVYRSVTGTTASATQVVDDGIRDDGLHPVGAGASLLLEGANQKVVYQDQETADLDVASSSAGAWTHTTANTGPIGYGWWPHLVSGGSREYVSQFMLDRSATPIGSLNIEALP